MLGEYLWVELKKAHIRLSIVDKGKGALSGLLFAEGFKKLLLL